MAKLDDKITITVTPRLEVDYETARLCITLLNVFLKDNREYSVSYVDGGVVMTSVSDAAIGEVGE